MSDLLHRAAALTNLATRHDEVRIAVVRTCQRYDVKGIGELADKHPEVFETLASAFESAVEQGLWT